MVMLRLFRQTDPFHPIEERRLDDGELVIGRGQEATWSLPDPTRLLSRRHCVISVVGGEPAMRDVSANGVFLGANRDRAPPEEQVNLQHNEALRFGDYLLVVDPDGGAQSVSPQSPPADAPFLRPVDSSARDRSSASGPAASPPDTASLSSSHLATEGSLLEAFCSGAQLDASAFSDEDPEAVMRRLGAVYRQMVLGLTGLMNERTTIKADYRLECTTVEAAGNNPFRWADASRVAIDLLRPRDDGFLSGPTAVRASFGDVQTHMLCLFSGLRAALEAALETLSPGAIETRIQKVGFWRNRSDAAWRAYVAAHIECQRDAGEDSDGLVHSAFRAGYSRRLAELDCIGESPQ